MSIQRQECTIYIVPSEVGSEPLLYALPVIDKAKYPDNYRVFKFFGETATVIVVSQVATVTREKALEVAARYITRKFKIITFEFPQPSVELRAIIQQENRKKRR